MVGGGPGTLGGRNCPALWGEDDLSWNRQRNSKRVRKRLGVGAPGPLTIEHQCLAPAYGVLPWQAERPLPARVPREREQALDVIESHKPSGSYRFHRDSRDANRECRMQRTECPRIKLDGSLTRNARLIS